MVKKLVAITGQVGTSLIGTDAFQEADITGITLPITKHNELVTDVERIPAAIAEAFHIEMAAIREIDPPAGVVGQHDRGSAEGHERSVRSLGCRRDSRQRRGAQAKQAGRKIDEYHVSARGVGSLVRGFDAAKRHPQVRAGHRVPD